MKKTTHLKIHASREAAVDSASAKAAAHRQGDRTVFCVLEGPDDGQWTVADLRTAIETELPYHAFG